MPTPLDRALAEHLEFANRHVAESQRRVDEQLTLLARLERDGHDARRAKALLRQFEEILTLQMETRDRIAQEARKAQ